MIFRLISSIIFLILIVFFVGFNLDNKCDVNLLFYKFQQIPVFYTILISYALGVLVTIPAILFREKKPKKDKSEKKAKKNKKNKNQNEEIKVQPETENQNQQAQNNFSNQTENKGQE